MQVQATWSNVTSQITAHSTCAVCPSERVFIVSVWLGLLVAVCTLSWGALVLQKAVFVVVVGGGSSAAGFVFV